MHTSGGEDVVTRHVHSVFLKISFQKKIKKYKLREAQFFFWRFWILFWRQKPRSGFGIFFEDDWRSRYYFLKVVLKMIFCLVLKHKIKAKQRETAEKGLKIFRGRLTAPKTIDLWLFPAKSFETGIFFWRLVIFFEYENREAVFRFFFEGREAAIFFEGRPKNAVLPCFEAQNQSETTRNTQTAEKGLTFSEGA